MAKYLLFVFAASLPLTDVIQSYVGTGSLAEALLLPLAAAAFYELLMTGPVWSSGVVLNVAFGAVVLLSWIYGGGQEVLTALQVKWKPVGHHAEYMVTFLVVAVLCRDHRARLALLRGLWVGCTIAVAIALAQWFLGSDARLFWRWGPDWAQLYADYGSFRIWGSFSNPLNLVTYLAPFLGLGVPFLFNARRGWTRWYYGAMLLIIALVMVMSGSKTALLVLVLPTLVFLRAARPVTSVAVALATGFLVWISGADTVLLERSQGPLTQLYSVTQRRHVIAAAFKMIRDYPLLGVGPDNFRDVYPLHYWTPIASSWQHAFTSENLFLQIAAEEGIIAFLLLGLILARGIAAGIIAMRTRPLVATGDAIVTGAVALAIACYVVAAQTNAATGVATNLLLFALLGVQEAWWLQRRPTIAVAPVTPDDFTPPAAGFRALGRPGVEAGA